METPRRALRNLHLENVQQMGTPLRLPPSPFMKNLGYGTGVSVYKLERSPQYGKLRSPWALKKVSLRNTDDDRAEIFNARIQKEAVILRKLSHPNIVGFRGVAKASNGNNTLVLECCNTSLGAILEDRHDAKLGPLPVENSLKMINDIANALDYLHTEAKLLHGDLKSFNILVKGEFETCKLCDFGVSLPIDDNGLIDFVKNPELRYVGTNLWSAPEIMDEADVIDSKADIFSFGLVIYETIALIPPHTLNMGDCSENSHQDDDTADEILEDLVESIDNACGTRPPLPESFELGDAYNQIVEIFYCCTQDLAEDRPTAKAILTALNIKAK